jgi:hypothetical protein
MRDGKVGTAASRRNFLQRDDIRIDLADHVENALRFAAPVAPDGAVHVVRGKPQNHNHRSARHIAAHVALAEESERDER